MFGKVIENSLFSPQMAIFVSIVRIKNKNRFEKNSICDYITQVLFNFIRV